MQKDKMPTLANQENSRRGRYVRKQYATDLSLLSETRIAKTMRVVQKRRRYSQAGP